MANNTARLYRIETLIRARGHVSFKTLLDELEVSPATLKRDLDYLRSRLGAPIEVQVLSPPALVLAVRQRLAAAAALYGQGDAGGH